MGSAGIAIGPDGKVLSVLPLKRQERRSQPARGVISKHGNRRGMGGMAGRPLHGGPGPMGNPGFGRPGPFREPYGPGGPFLPGNRGPMPFGMPGRNMGFGESNPNVSFFKGPQSMPGPNIVSWKSSSPC
ncbi:hypothetical protein DICVIV_02889 [Dictyocaulus viviparus]|uniref:Uncharacterized protein n=1 Tax=Dictyocaulus viviparus TaxID=29172 RepID=A0A0D8Y242_DICVI|nr:hypothetical protein DICVIV_02889 [Dictyocaulus viviparus]